MSVTATYRGLDTLNSEFRQQVENWFDEVVTHDKRRLKVSELIFVTETSRSRERQAYLFSQGLSYLNGTPPRVSKHQEGLAVDVAFHGNELYPSMRDERWRLVADAAKKHGIDWGYDLWGWDAPHFQDAKGEYISPPPEYGRIPPPYAVPIFRAAARRDVSTDLWTVVGTLPNGNPFYLFQLLAVQAKLFNLPL